MKHLTEKSDSLKLFHKLTEGTNQKRISKYREFDNGYILHSWYEMTDEEAEEQARQASIKDPTDIYYVQYDDVMNPCSDIRWYQGNQYSIEQAQEIQKKNGEANYEKMKMKEEYKSSGAMSKDEILSKIFSQFPDISKEDENYLNDLPLDGLINEVYNRNWEKEVFNEAVIPNSTNSVCPKCGSNNFLEIDDEEDEDGTQHFHLTCQDCGYTEKDEYNLNESSLKESYEVWQRYFEDGQITTEYVQTFDTWEEAQKFADGLNRDPDCEAWVKDINESEDVSAKLEEDSLNTNTIELYMNTWGNYNEHGADVENINGGWMDIDQAKEFLEAHKDEEPFINDTENVPGDLGIDEYTNPWEAIEELEYIENSDNKDALIAIIESTGDFDNAKEIYESGDYTFFSGVEDDEGLGRAYVDMVGGLEGVTNVGNYIDEEAYKESWREAAEQDIRENNPDLDENSDEFEDEVENWLNGVAMEELENEKAAGNDLSEYFDYEAFGRDLDFEGYFFASTGAIQTN